MHGLLSELDSTGECTYSTNSKPSSVWSPLFMLGSGKWKATLLLEQRGASQAKVSHTYTPKSITAHWCNEWRSSLTKVLCSLEKDCFVLHGGAHRLRSYLPGQVPFVRFCWFSLHQLQLNEYFHSSQIVLVQNKIYQMFASTTYAHMHGFSSCTCKYHNHWSGNETSAQAHRELTMRTAGSLVPRLLFA